MAKPQSTMVKAVVLKPTATVELKMAHWQNGQKPGTNQNQANAQPQKALPDPAPPKRLAITEEKMASPIPRFGICRLQGFRNMIGFV
ncbi:hypothetical protein IFM51744_06931 [Aspergillus udagawae]|nr:hypothetical protein IFM51744_06931 [Aspergillus udagawae]